MDAISEQENGENASRYGSQISDTDMARNEYQNISSADQSPKQGFFSYLLFSWMDSTFKTGSKRALQESDFVPLSTENTTRAATEKLQSNWNKEKTKYRENGKKPRLWKSVLKMLSVKDIIIFSLSGAMYSVSKISLILLITYLISALLSSQAQNNLAYLSALAMFITSLFQAMGHHHVCYRGELTGIRVSCALKGLIYHKMLLLSKHGVLKATTGYVIELLSNDVQRMEGETVKYVFLTVSSTVEFLALPFLLLYLIGWQALVGFISLSLLIVYFAGLSYMNGVLRVKTAEMSGLRLSLMNQVISGIRAIKMYTCENEYRARIKYSRRNEIKILNKKNAVLTALVALEGSSGPVALLVSVLTFLLTGHTLTPVNVTMLLAFIGAQRLNPCCFLAYGWLQIYEAYVSLLRIEDFLLLKDLPAVSCDHTSDKSKSDLKELKSGLTEYEERVEVNHFDDATDERGMAIDLCVSNLTCMQVGREEEYILENIDLGTESKSLTVITGPVGSGKSTLLSAIAGEVPKKKGTLTRPEKLAYVPQIAWVFSGTIRENILFGLPYDEQMYKRVLRACALDKDMQEMPDGDLTVVGERGEVLSGGQQARVSLARAVYADADLYLLDDPFSALDFKVGQHIFENCIQDFLGDKTRVLISHQEQHMKEATEVVVLYKGRVLGRGTFTDLQGEGFLNTTVNPLHQKAPKDSTFDKKYNEQEEKFIDISDEKDPPSTGEKGLTISDEDRTIGRVSPKLYWDYFSSGTHSMGILSMMCLFPIAQAIIVAPDVWLSLMTKKLPEDQRNKINIIIYTCLVSGCVMLAFVRAYAFLWISLKCSESLHDLMVEALLRSPVLFFDSNPVGRILNRFSKDIGCMDELLPKEFLLSIQLLLLAICTILIPTVANPWVLFVIIPLMTFVAFVSKYYSKTSRELKRLESISRSPVFSHISETLNGLDTIRTRNRQRDFVHELYRYQDTHNQISIMVMASARWLGVRLDVVASLIVGSVAAATAFVAQDAAIATLALVYVVQITDTTQTAVRRSLNVDNLMTSVERVMTYTKLDSEPGYKVEKRPPEHWPREGKITFKDVSLTYYPGGPQVLKKINLEIKGGTKIGIAGRTGAGKTSVLAALLRMPDADGQIMVDDIPIMDINIQEARRCISVLGQRPVLFSGTLRKNLDLLEQFQDKDLWQALRDTQLKDVVESLEGQLDYKLSEHGADISVGERQLICLARVLLHRSKIIILDEPTAHVDPETEHKMWRVVREKLKDCTVITIAHRLSSIKDCDMILVLENGEIREFGKFDLLVRREGGILSEMARVSGI